MLDENEKDEARLLLQGAALIASNYGPVIYEECESPRQAITAMAIMMVSMSLACGVSMHDLMGVVMAVYRKSEVFHNMGDEE